MEIYLSSLQAVVLLVQQWLSTGGKAKNTKVIQSTRLNASAGPLWCSQPFSISKIPTYNFFICFFTLPSVSICTFQMNRGKSLRTIWLAQALLSTRYKRNYSHWLLISYSFHLAISFCGFTTIHKNIQLIAKQLNKNIFLCWERSIWEKYDAVCAPLAHDGDFFTQIFSMRSGN